MSDEQAKLYIAGRGLSCSLGNTLTACLASLTAAMEGAPPSSSEAGFPYFSIQPPAPADAAAWTERARQLVVSTVQEAKAALQHDSPAIRYVPLFIASSSLNMGAIERGQERLEDMHAEAEQIAAWLDWQGPVYWISTACTSSINALLSAARAMRSGRCDEALILGIELANQYTSSGFAAMQLLSPTAAQPLGKDRDGLVLGEAVAALWLSKRPQRWELLGGASVVSDKDSTGASHDAVVACWRQALRESGLDPRDAPVVDLVKLQAAGSPRNDVVEVSAVDTVFAHTPALTTLKAHIGHTLGASGAAEIALLTGVLEAGIWPVTSHAQDASLPHALSPQRPVACARLLASIIGFGGSHGCVVLQDNGIDSASFASPFIPAATSTSAPLWEVCGRSGAALPEDWRDRVSALLGQRPRRIGNWAEVGLYGALQCMHAAGETSLPAGAILRISSLHGPMAAILQTLHNIAEDGNAMPFAFLQSQPGQLPAILAQALQWHGSARVTNHRNALSLLALACNEAGPDGALIGWLEEPGEAQQGSAPATSFWLRLRPAGTPESATFATATLDNLHVCRYVRMGLTRLEIAI